MRLTSILYSKLASSKEVDPDAFFIYHKDSPVLDVRSVDENNNLISIYDKIFFK